MDFPGSFMDPTFYDLPLHHSDVNQQLHDAAARHHFHDVTNLDGGNQHDPSHDLLEWGTSHDGNPFATHPMLELFPAENAHHNPERTVALNIYTPDHGSALIVVEPAGRTADGGTLYEAVVTNNTGTPLDTLLHDPHAQVHVGYRGDAPENVDAMRSDPTYNLQSAHQVALGPWSGVYATADPAHAAQYVASNEGVDERGRPLLGEVSRVLASPDVVRYVSDIPGDHALSATALGFVSHHASQTGFMIDLPESSDGQNRETFISPLAAQNLTVVPAPGHLTWDPYQQVQFVPDTVEAPADPNYRVWMHVPSESAAPEPQTSPPAGAPGPQTTPTHDEL